MKELKGPGIDIRVLDDGQVMVRRLDGHPPTKQDQDMALKIADASPGITEQDVLRIFGGGKVIARLNR